MLPLDFHPLVEADLSDSAEWYGHQQLPANAFLYAVRFADIRRVNLPVFKHGVFYFIADEALVVLAILHGHRDSKAELQRRRKKYG